MLAKNGNAYRLTGPCEDAHKRSQPDHVPAIEASRRASALTGRTFLKYQGTLVLEELFSWSKERKWYLRYGTRNISIRGPNACAYLHIGAPVPPHPPLRVWKILSLVGEGSRAGHLLSVARSPAQETRYIHPPTERGDEPLQPGRVWAPG